MPTKCYTVTPHPIESLLIRVKSCEIAIPEIKRPFVTLSRSRIPVKPI
jgi:hypothetical protein